MAALLASEEGRIEVVEQANLGGTGGFTVPERVEFGNLWGTPDYAPFFLATIPAARF